MANKHTYRVAGHLFSIDDRDGSRSWCQVRRAYEPFLADDSEGEHVIDIVIEVGDVSVDGLECSFGAEQMRDPDNQLRNILPYKAPGAEYVEYYAIIQTGLDRPAALLHLSADFRHAHIILDETSAGMPVWMVTASLTTSIQMAYMGATAHLLTLMSHASCVTCGGKAFLFIAKSGTGKSTHSRMWLENIPDVTLLNDDHPIVRVVDGVPMAYGSPWSGKTPCYKNIEAPIGAITRINRAPHNAIHKLHPVQAYASLCTSFSGITFIPQQADERHRALEAVIAAVPCYVLDCRPDAEAAQVCHNEMFGHRQ